MTPKQVLPLYMILERRTPMTSLSPSTWFGRNHMLHSIYTVYDFREKDTYDFTLPQYMIRQKHMLHSIYTVYDFREKDTYDFTLPQYMIRQKHMLHGLEAKNLKYIPKVTRKSVELTRRCWLANNVICVAVCYLRFEQVRGRAGSRFEQVRGSSKVLLAGTKN